MAERKDILKARFLHLHRQGLKDAVIAERLGVTRQAVAWHRQQFGLTANRPRNRPWTEAERETVRRRLAEGATYKQVGEEVGRRATDVRWVSRVYGLRPAAGV